MVPETWGGTIGYARRDIQSETKVVCSRAASVVHNFSPPKSPPKRGKKSSCM